MKDNEDNNYGEINITSLIERYEAMRQDSHSCYFDVEDFESIVSYYLYNDDAEKAREAVNDGMYFHPNSLELKLRLIEIEIEAEHTENALDLIEEVKRFAYSYKAEITVLEARILLSQQKVSEAVSLLDNLLKVYVGENEIDLQAAIGSLMNMSEHAHAARYLEFMSKQQGNAGNVLLDLAYCYERLDDTHKALATYERYLDENPFSTLAWYELAKMYERDSQSDNAIKAYDFVLTIDPNYIEAYYGKAEIQVNNGEYEQATKTLEGLLDEYPNNIRATYTLGECYEKLDRLEDALRCYLLAIKNDESYAEAYYSAAFLFKEQGKYYECVMFLKKATSLEPENGEYFYGLGKVLMELGQPEEAIQAFKNALENDKYDFESWLLLAELYAVDDFDKALAVLEEASAFLYDIPEISYRIAALYFLTDNIDKCAEHFERGILLDAEKASDFFDLCPTARHDERIMTIYINSKTRNSI